MNFQEYLNSIHACEEASLWAKDKTAIEAWETCERPDWLMWWATRKGHINELSKLVEVAKQLANFVQKYSTYAGYAAAAGYAGTESNENTKQLLKIIRDNLVQPWIEPTPINLKLQDDLGSFNDSL